MKIRLRFAPSPTGEIHIGNIRTAIINWLFTRRSGGEFVLRIEDTDRQRSERIFEDIILREMDWLGLNIDEGLGAGGNYGPYRQTERLDLYKKYADILVEEGSAFPCFCTPEEIDAHREEARAAGKNLHYSGACRNLSKEEISKFRQEGRPEGLRFKNPGFGEIEFVDLIRGKVNFQVDLLDDFTIIKSDGTPTYNFACVIDDYLMEITHVLRGEDHLPNTPKQLLIYKALGWQPPLFGHLSLILDKSGQVFKKRSGGEEVFIGRYRDKGYLPEALFNYISLLGWSPEEDREIFTKDEAVKLFSLQRVNSSPAIFDLDKLNWLNSLYIRELTPEKLLLAAEPFLTKHAVALKGKPLEYLVRAFQPRVTTLDELAKDAKSFLEPLVFSNPEQELEFLCQDGIESVLSWFQEKLRDGDSLTPQDTAQLIKDSMKELNVKGKMVYKPIRIALTGKESGPEINDIMAFLGAKECCKRLEYTLSLLGKGSKADE